MYMLLQGCVAPSSTDSGSTGSFIYNFFWGKVCLLYAGASVFAVYLLMSRRVFCNC